MRVKIFGFSEGKKGEIESSKNPHVVSFYSRQRVSKRWLGTFDVPSSPDEARVVEFSGWINPDEQIEVFLASMEGRDAQGDGIAIESLQAEGPIYESWPPASHQELFADLPVEPWTVDSGYLPPSNLIEGDNEGKKKRHDGPPQRYMIVSEHPLEDARRLLSRFIEQAFRRPITDTEADRYVDLVRVELDAEACFDEAMRVGYQAVLCSPDFLFLRENPGTLNDHELAARLSYFLWSSLPDDELRQRARSETLSDPHVLREQVERMLSDPKAERFVDNFVGQWLRLRDLTDTDPDGQLYPEYDELLRESMQRETLAYVHEMLRDDLGIRHVVDSDFAMLNARLADLYSIADVHGVDIRRVSLPSDSVRGGLLTQASVLKVTANGTSTSPVTRGVWITERILGRHVPPPPSNVSGIEPDLRGTTTIREQLSKHREVDSCAACHRIIDPPGFALECFDVIGGFRDRYRSVEIGDEPDADSQLKIKYKLGLPVDASGETIEGDSFADIRSYRETLLADPERLARNVSEKLLTYATGGGIEFADREAIAEIVQNAKANSYGLRTLVHGVVQSEVFRTK